MDTTNTTNTMNKIKLLIKQNDSIYLGLCNKNIEFTRHQINTSDTYITEENCELILQQLSTENECLKNIVKNNKPAPKIITPNEKKEVISLSKINNDKSIKNDKSIQNKDEDDDNKEDDEIYETPIKKFNTITNMEDIKRAFFNKDYTLFESLIKQHELLYYKVTYKYASDKDGAPEFSAKNLIGGTIRQFDDYKKYFMICFRCWKNSDTTYTYPSYWIVNSTDKISDIIGLTSEDFEFVQITSDVDKEIFLKEMQKEKDKTDIDNPLLIGESYVH